MRKYASIAQEYALQVLDGRIVACSWVRKACQRFRDDWIAAGDSKCQWKFDTAAVTKICLFAEGLSHIKGKWAKRAEKIHLEPWQIFIYANVFGFVSRKTGMRRYRTAYLEMARKNGKSTFSAPVGVYMTCADREPGAEVYSAATTRDQAKIVWEAAKAMIEREPDLRAAFGVETFAHSIFQSNTMSRFQALSAEGGTLDGLSVHCAIVDELHAHKTRTVYDVIETARAARSQPLLWLITTAGSDRAGICYEQRTYLTKILDGVVQDDSYFGVIYTMDDADDWRDESAWQKANPNLGISVDIEELRRLKLKAEKMPSAQANFMTKHLSAWVNADAPLFDMIAWQACGDENLRLDDFANEPCWIGIDLAPKHDFSVIAQLFKREDRYYAFVRHFLSEMEVEDSSNSQYSGWAAEGLITTNPGNVTDYGAIEEELHEIAKNHELLEVCYDKFSAHQFATRMQDEGFPMVEVGATVANFSEATKRLDALISEGKIQHNGDPILAWEMSNVVGHYDRKDNVFPVKERPENKIDGPIAIIMALNRALVSSGEQKSVYDNPGEAVWL